MGEPVDSLLIEFATTIDEVIATLNSVINPEASIKFDKPNLLGHVTRVRRAVAELPGDLYTNAQQVVEGLKRGEIIVQT